MKKNNTYIKRKAVSKHMRNTLREMHGDAGCHYCGCSIVWKEHNSGYLPPNTASVDHVIPVSRGGENILSNLVACCYKCNSHKMNMNARLFVFILKRFGHTGVSRYHSFMSPFSRDKIRKNMRGPFRRRWNRYGCKFSKFMLDKVL